MTKDFWRRPARALLLTLATAAAPALANADELPTPDGPFSGLVTTVAGDLAFEMRMWVDGANRRMEGEISGEKQIIITNGDLGRIYMISPDRNQGMSMKLTPEAAGIEEQMQDWQATREGEETINGVTATRYSVMGDSPLGGSITGFLWFDANGVLIRSSLESVVNGATVVSEHEVKDVEIGPVDPALFQPPAGVELMEIGG
jgi:hypothetical protein